MELYSFRIVPESAWRTPWQSDTLAGMLCGAIARLEGNQVVRREVIDPALEGCPPFVISDAFPAGCLPVPVFARFLDWKLEDRKAVKRARWFNRESCESLQRGQLATLNCFVMDSGFHEATHLHNTISRRSDGSLQQGGLYPREETYLAKQQSHLTVYVRMPAQFLELFSRALHELATGGFGADRSAGKGQFRVDGGLESAAALDQIAHPNALVSLSTFQPKAGDPTDGAWAAFTKYGKLGPEFGLENVFKRPMVMLKPGASFQTTQIRHWLGRAIPMRELLAPEAVAALAGQGIEMVHYAFGLVVPFVWPRTSSPGQPRVMQAPAVGMPARTDTAQCVEVVLLEQMPKTGPKAFRVQEEGKPKGMLNHGTPPTPLPEVGAKVPVYCEPTSRPSNPTYRWSKPQTSEKHKSQRRGGRQ